jgi:glycosyltransferase involved in cell wall biosynthesis
MSKSGVCLVSGIYPPDKGGPAQFVSSYSDWLEKKGIPATILSFTDNSDFFTHQSLKTICLISRQRNIASRFLKSLREISNLSKQNTLLVNGMFVEIGFLSLFKKFDYIAKVPGDIVWERARNQGETNVDIDSYQGQENLSKRFMRFFFLRSLQKAREVISPSHHLADLIESWGVSRQKIAIVRNSADLSLFSPLEASASFQYDLLTICRLTPWKGVDEIISEAASRNLSLCVIGSGPDSERLKSLAREHKVKADFLGGVPQSELSKYLNSSQFFILNSSYEGSPHALIEAMAAGSLVIARDSSGTKELVNDLENGILCGERRTLDAALELALHLGNREEELRKNARKTIRQEYDREKTFAAILSILKATA